MKKPVAITIGDPSGIGPEIVAKLILDQEFAHNYPFIPVGTKFILEDAFENILKISPPEYEVFSFPEIPPFKIKYGKHSEKCGKISMQIIEKAVELVHKGIFSAITTCPINKHSIELAGYNFHGHTEYLGYLTNSDNFSMMLASKNVRVVLVTTHLPIKELSSSITKKSVEKAIINANIATKMLKIKNPEIPVCGFNPHAGDCGTLGYEEIEIIEPVVKKMQQLGINATGPYPADNLFSRLKENMVVVAMYHDQGLIPVKMDGFGSAVNITLNLPIIRTSVDHGTAFDIAGKGIANENSLKQAIIAAHKMSEA